ncbi:hypothetical protein ACQY0O_008183 [Thecaphora frezii]
MQLSLLFSLLLSLLLLPVRVHSMQRGLAWGTDNRWGSRLSPGSSLYKWYWHWQDGPNPLFANKLEFVPCFWGKRYTSDWQQRKSEMDKQLPKAILGFNEPDVPSQSNMLPKEAAELWVKEIQPYKAKGVRLGSPQIAWDVDWLSKFVKELGKVGGSVDFIAIHWYGRHTDLSLFQAYVAKVYRTFQKPIWVTEYGVTSAGGGTQAQVKQFHIDATTWLDSQSYVERASSFGAFAVSDPPDAYGSAKNALFNADGSLRELARWYSWTSSGAKAKRHRGKRRLGLQQEGVAEEEKVGQL